LEVNQRAQKLKEVPFLVQSLQPQMLHHQGLARHLLQHLEVYSPKSLQV
jgi:predicted glycosyltransferase